VESSESFVDNHPPTRRLRVLIAEDSEDDALLLERALRAVGFAVTSQRVDTADAMRAALARETWDIVLSDYSMPQFTALDALDIVHASSQPDVPFVIVSGSIGEESAVASLKAGASNYIMKRSLAQLLPVVDRALKDAQIRKEREQAFAALEQAVAARNEFLSIASHELKTPVAALRLAAEGLLFAAKREDNPLASAVVVRRIESIERSARRLTNLIERLLDTTRVGTDPVVRSGESVDLVEIVKHAVDELADTLRAARCDVSIDAPADLRGAWDGDRLGTVVSNLVANAAKYCAKRPIRIVIEDRGDTARLSVIDQGIGISPVDQARIFDRFERAAAEGGFGVGLWLVRRIVEAHGGTIEVTSESGQGSCFTVSLPKR
jgi:signal transduction histidine kinase